MIQSTVVADVYFTVGENEWRIQLEKVFWFPAVVPVGSTLLLGDGPFNDLTVNKYQVWLGSPDEPPLIVECNERMEVEMWRAIGILKCAHEYGWRAGDWDRGAPDELLDAAGVKPEVCA